MFNINHTYIYSLYIYIKFSPATLSWMKMTIYCMIMWNAYNLTFTLFFHSVNPSWMNINMFPALCNYFWKKTSFLFPSNIITGDHRGLGICCFFGFLASKDFNYLAFKYFDFEGTRWRLFQKRVVCTKLDIYVFISVKMNEKSNKLSKLKTLLLQINKEKINQYLICGCIL